MIKLTIDKFGNGQKDVLLEIDLVPSFLTTSDSYYLFDFLEISVSELDKSITQQEEALILVVQHLISYWIDKIKSSELKQKFFLPFDFSDEYVGGLSIEKLEIGLKIKPVFCDKIFGYSVSISNLDEQFLKNQSNFLLEADVEWVVHEETFLEELEWSKSNLETKT